MNKNKDSATFLTREARNSDTMILVVLAVGGSLLFVLPVLTWACYKCYKVQKRGTTTSEEATYSVAVSNHLFKDDDALMKADLPCQNCKLIEMGSMACYTETCPACGKPPPGGPRVMRGECRDINIPMPCKPSCLKGEKSGD